jgi:transcriptional regulator with XRE-family HTH domain
MKTQFDVDSFLEKGKIENELDFERALIADRKLRVMAKENPKLKAVRKKLRDLIEAYESKTWSPDAEISEDKLKESDWAEQTAEKERLFIHNRKKLIKSRLKELDLSQQDFGVILGHTSKSYMSELMNGVSPFSLKDLVVISQLLKIELTDLVPTFLPQKERIKIKTSIKKLDNPKLSLSEDDFALA